VVCADGVIGEKYILLVVWDRRWRNLVGRVVWASGDIGILCQYVVKSLRT
jgi:hypothetical protein